MNLDNISDSGSSIEQTQWLRNPPTADDFRHWLNLFALSFQRLNDLQKQYTCSAYSRYMNYNRIIVKLEHNHFPDNHSDNAIEGFHFMLPDDSRHCEFLLKNAYDKLSQADRRNIWDYHSRVEEATEMTRRPKREEELVELDSDGEEKYYSGPISPSVETASNSTVPYTYGFTSTEDSQLDHSMSEHGPPPLKHFLELAMESAGIRVSSENLAEQSEIDDNDFEHVREEKPVPDLTEGNPLEHDDTPILQAVFEHRSTENLNVNAADAGLTKKNGNHASIVSSAELDDELQVSNAPIELERYQSITEHEDVRSNDASDWMCFNRFSFTAELPSDSQIVHAIDDVAPNTDAETHREPPEIPEVSTALMAESNTEERTMLKRSIVAPNTTDNMNYQLQPSCLAQIMEGFVTQTGMIPVHQHVVASNTNVNNYVQAFPFIGGTNALFDSLFVLPTTQRDVFTDTLENATSHAMADVVSTSNNSMNSNKTPKRLTDVFLSETPSAKKARNVTEDMRRQEAITLHDGFYCPDPMLMLTNLFGGPSGAPVNNKTTGDRGHLRLLNRAGNLGFANSVVQCIKSFGMFDLLSESTRSGVRGRRLGTVSRALENLLHPQHKDARSVGNLAKLVFADYPNYLSNGICDPALFYAEMVAKLPKLKVVPKFSIEGRKELHCTCQYVIKKFEKPDKVVLRSPEFEPNERDIELGSLVQTGIEESFGICPNCFRDSLQKWTSYFVPKHCEVIAIQTPLFENGAKIQRRIIQKDTLNIDGCSWTIGACVEHLGSSLNGGTCRAWIKEGQQWNVYEDDAVLRDQELPEFLENMYLVFFVRQ